MPNFLEELNKRRTARIERYDRSAGRFRASLRRSIAEVKRQAAALASDPVTGEILDTTAARIAATEMELDLRQILARWEGASNAELLAMRERETIHCYMEIRFAIDESLDVSVGASFNQAFEEAAKIAQDSKVLGRSFSRPFRGTSRLTERKVQDAITRGILQGKPVPDVAQDIDRALNIGQNAATTVTRTNLNASANDATRLLIESDPEIFAGYRWDSTFDSRTSAICASLHGRFYPLGSNPPGPPAHPNCRSSLIPVFKDPAVDKEVTDGMKRAAQHDKDGDKVRNKLIPADTSFDKWLRKQPDPVVRRITGSEVKQELFNAEALRADDLTSLNLEVLDDREAIRRAVSLRPSNSTAQSLAKEFNVKQDPKSRVMNRELRRASAVPFTTGRRKGTPKNIQERLDRINKRKAQGRDNIERSARRLQAQT